METVAYGHFGAEGNMDQLPYVPLKRTSKRSAPGESGGLRLRHGLLLGPGDHGRAAGPEKTVWVCRYF